MTDFQILHSMAKLLPIELVDKIMDFKYGLFHREKMDKMNLYCSKVKALFDSRQAAVTDRAGVEREHIVSNVNITKIDKILTPFKERLNETMDNVMKKPAFSKLENY